MCIRASSELAQNGPLPDLGFSQSGLALMLKAMDSVSNVPGGTAYRSRITESGMELAGKTGTAQVRRISRAECESGGLQDAAVACTPQPLHTISYCSDALGS